MSTHC